MPDTPPDSFSFPRLTVGGKWLRAGAEKWRMRGVSYGPFRPNSRGEPFPEDAPLRVDLAHIVKLGFNTVRLYELPSPAVIQAATALGLRLLVGIPWTDHVDFLRNKAQQDEIRQTVVGAVSRLKDEPCVAGFVIGNEIEKTLVRWMGPSRVRDFLDDLIETARAVAPHQLFSYANYPSTEYLIPAQADFLAVNLYLEQPEALAAYLQRLQNLAGDKPLVITEFGLDVAVHGEEAQAQTWAWFQSSCHHAAVAGTVWFSYTDEWFRGGEAITQWRFGLVDSVRQERPVCGSIKMGAPAHSPRPQPRISVIVCTYNGIATLRGCLESLARLRYPDFEVLVIDDGSTKDIAGIAKDFPQIRYVRQEHAGLSVARNLGASLATGEILAYTDDDCLVDEDWLTHLSLGFEDPQWTAAGGPNIPPPPRNRTEAVVAAAPGAPAHVLLTDIEAEHLPGCNLAIRKSALEAIGGFRPQYRVAGDDVDVCWRLREAGGRLHFVPGAMVWHHRRYTVSAYLRQQRGYGRAEALLMKDHPERFGPLGGARWFGGIYGDRATALHLEEGSIFHGPLGEGLFQGIYRQGPRCWLDWMGGVIWVVLLLAALMLHSPLSAALILSFSLLLAACRLRTQTRAPFSLSLRESCLLLGLCWLQPLLRECERLRGMVRLHGWPGGRKLARHIRTPGKPRKATFSSGEWSFWSTTNQTRATFLEKLQAMVAEQKFSQRADDGWRLFDLEVAPQRQVSTAMVSVVEYHSNGQELLRVRSLIRIRHSALAIYGGVILLLITGLWTPWPWHALARNGLMMTCLYTLSLLYYFKGRCKKLVLQAAEQAGLKELA
ncbi:MAG TPA: glycosyl transferase [Verrucomicrobiales bacterium]|nr:glycosyl transferase [Verrucomicrobiales bacterium]